MEEETDNFDVSWLNDRYPFDAAAREKKLEKEVLSFLEGKEEIHLVDAGAGTGANFLYFTERLPANQKWYLIEQNSHLKNATLKRLSDYATYHKYPFERKKNQVVIHSGTRIVEIQIINGSLTDLDQLIPLQGIDLLLANAVFDLLTSRQFDRFFRQTIEFQIPLYTTLNYEKMVFLPDDPFDEIFIRIYNEHMEREQSFGEAMGIKAPTIILEKYAKKNWQCQSAESIWNVGAEDIKMHYYLLDFMENALAEMNMNPDLVFNFEKWLQRKKDLIITRQQDLEIIHRDIFVQPQRLL